MLHDGDHHPAVFRPNLNQIRGAVAATVVQLTLCTPTGLTRRTNLVSCSHRSGEKIFEFRNVDIGWFYIVKGQTYRCIHAYIQKRRNWESFFLMAAWQLSHLVHFRDTDLQYVLKDTLITSSIVIREKLEVTLMCIRLSLVDDTEISTSTAKISKFCYRVAFNHSIFAVYLMRPCLLR